MPMWVYVMTKPVLWYFLYLRGLVRDTQHNDIQHNGLNCDTQLEDTQHEDTQHEDTQHYKPLNDDAQH
jgi:hypothetical protein